MSVLQGSQTRFFVEIKMFSRRIASFWAAKHEFRALASQMDGSSWKRKLVRLVIPTMARLTLLCKRASARSSPTAEVTELIGPLIAVAAEHYFDIHGFAIFYPGGLRAHRRYVVGVNQAGIPRLFTKVTTLPGYDGNKMHSEHRMLQQLKGNPLEGWLTPNSYGVYSTMGHLALTMDSLPERRRNISWDHMLNALPLRHRKNQGQEALRDTSEIGWFPSKPADLCCSETFRSLVQTIRNRQINVRTIHGDIRPSNAFVTNTQRWLLDWEFSAMDGPAYADLVGGELNRLIDARPGTDPIIVLRLLLTQCNHLGIGLEDVVLSVLYLSNLNTTWPQMLLQLDWPLTMATEQVRK